MADLTANRTFLTQGDEQGIPYWQTDDRAASSFQLDTYVESEHSRLQKKMREVSEVDALLAMTQQNYDTKLLELQRREKEFKAKQLEMLQTIKSCKGLIVETDTKRNKALHKANEERKQAERKENAARELNGRLHEIRQNRNELKKKYVSLKPYQHFLEGVIARSDLFHEVEEILTRYRVLSDTNSDLRAQGSEALNAVEQLHAQYQNLLKEKQNDILVKNSELARCQKTLEDASHRTMALEQELESSDAKAKDAMRRFSEIDMAVRNLAQRVLQSREVLMQRQLSQANTAVRAALLANKRKNTMHQRLQEELARAPEAMGSEKRADYVRGTLTRLMEEVGQRMLELIDITAITGDESEEEESVAHGRGRSARNRPPSSSSYGSSGSDRRNESPAKPRSRSIRNMNAESESDPTHSASATSAPSEAPDDRSDVDSSGPSGTTEPAHVPRTFPSRPQESKSSHRITTSKRSSPTTDSRGGSANGGRGEGKATSRSAHGRSPSKPDSSDLKLPDIHQSRSRNLSGTGVGTAVAQQYAPSHNMQAIYADLQKYGVTLHDRPAPPPPHHLANALNAKKPQPRRSAEPAAKPGQADKRPSKRANLNEGTGDASERSANAEEASPRSEAPLSSHTGPLSRTSTTTSSLAVDAN